jgi:hypothetical protein
VDFAVAVSGDAAAEALVHALVQRGWEVLAAVEQTVTGRLATARLTPPGDDDAGVVVDLLFASCGFEPEIVVEADEMELTDDVSLPVACTGHLLVMKLLARDDRTRPNDADDLRALAAVVDAGEIARARAAARLVQARGFHRGRDVPALLEAMLTDEHQR